MTLNRFLQRALPAAFLAALTLGCAGPRLATREAPGSHPAQPEQAKPAPSQDAARSASRATNPATTPAPAAALTQLQVDDVIREARSQYEVGARYFERGQVDEARSSFDKAIEILTTGPVGAKEDPRLADAYVDLLDQISEIEIASYQAGTGLSPEEPPPIDLLEEAEPEISPEEAEKERELAQNSDIPTEPPIVLNDRVLAWISAYQGRLHDRFQEGLTRSGVYLEMLKRIFREEGMPEDLVYMAHVESAYKPHAYSRARAKGMWQFIAGTGSRYGLRRDSFIDERSDPERSTRAAASYLRDLHAMFGDWYLAMAAYNAGERKIQRAMERTGRTDFWGIAQTSQIRLETKNYVPAILAAIVISKNPEKFGFSSYKAPAAAWDSVKIDSATDLGVAARLAGSSVDDLRELNPALTRLMTPPNYPDFELRVPDGSGETFTVAFKELPVGERIPWKQHTVRKGETLNAIAKRYGVSTTTIRQANALPPGSSLRAGMSLQIPASLAAPSGGHRDILGSEPRGGSKRASSASGSSVVTVRKGETLSAIAGRYRVTVAQLRAWNGLDSNTIRVGQRLVVKGGVVAPPRGGAGTGTARSTPSSKGLSSATMIGGGGGSSAKARTYKVRSGDTLYGIASRWSTTVEAICALNNLSASDPLHPGTILRLER